MTRTLKAAAALSGDTVLRWRTPPRSPRTVSIPAEEGGNLGGDGVAEQVSTFAILCTSAMPRMPDTPRCEERASRRRRIQALDRAASERPPRAGPSNGRRGFAAPAST
jgi:hypothetical protein